MRKTVLKGLLGEALDLTVAKRLKTVDYDLLVEPFAGRYENDGAWRCEFWGKIVRSAITAAFHTGDTELRAIIDKTVKDLMATQTPDGCISSYPEDKQLTSWDIWGRKYVLLALLRYYEMVNPDPAVLQCCCRMVDHLMTQIDSKKTDIRECGLHNGLASASILGAIVAVWRLSGSRKYRDFAQYIIDTGCSSSGNIFAGAIAGVVPAALGNGKAYEMTSCFQGVAELLQIENDPHFKSVVDSYYTAVRDREIFVTGCGGLKDISGEFWYEGALRQTRGDCGGLGETCVTATWIRYCMRMLELNDDCTIGDELEKSLYNGILGAIAPDHSHWAHVNPTPLTGNGYRECAVDQIGRNFGTPFGGNDCCRAQGPEGLSTAAAIAVMDKPGKVLLNLYEPLESGNLIVSGNYPVEPEAKIGFTYPEKYVLALRTPDFLKEVRLNGEVIPFTAGKYLEIDRMWSCGDEIVLSFDFTLKEIIAPGDDSFVAVKRGPLVLAEDSAGVIPEAKVHELWQGKDLCEYAACGKQMNEKNTLTVWFKR